MNAFVEDQKQIRAAPAYRAPERTMEELATIRSRLETARQLRYRTEKAHLARVHSLIEDALKAETAKRSFGQPGAPEDFGADGIASIARGLIKEDADGKWTGSAVRKGPKVERMRVQCECVLDSLYMRENSSMSEGQYLTGMRFRRFWIASRHAARVSGDYGQRIGGGRPEAEDSEYRQNARHQVEEAFELLTPARRQAVVSVCGEDEWPGDRQKTLMAALSILDDKWGRRKNALDRGPICR